MDNVKTKRKKIMIRYLIGGAIGALLGFLYYRFVGCKSGTCPITSSPFGSTIYGVIFGLLFSNLFTK